MNKTTQLELNEARIETGLSWVHSSLLQAIFAPSLCLPCAFYCQSKAHASLGRPVLAAQPWAGGRVCFVLFSVWGIGVHLWSHCPPTQVTRAILWLITEWGLVASAAQLSWSGVCSLSEFDTLQPGKVPGVRLLGPGFLLLFSLHTAAAFIIVPWTWSPSLVSQPSHLRCQGETKLVSLEINRATPLSTHPAPCELIARQWTKNVACCISNEHWASKDKRASCLKWKRLSLEFL